MSKAEEGPKTAEETVAEWSPKVLEDVSHCIPLPDGVFR